MKFSIIIFGGLLLLAGCQSSGQWHDKNIDPQVTNAVMKVNEALLDGLSHKDPRAVRKLASDQLLENGPHLDSLVQFGKWTLDPKKFRIKNQFYIRKSTQGEESKAVSGTGDEHDYAVAFNSTTRETYIATGYLESNLNALALVAVYGKYGDEWKLNVLQFGTMTIENKDAIDWYHAAKSNFGKGYLMDAALQYALSSQCLNPGNEFWKYSIEQDILDFGEILNTKVNAKYHFPLTVKEITSKPQIFRIYPQGMDEGYYPQVLYTTSLRMSDTTALSWECTDMHQRIGYLFKGFEKRKKYIFYRAFEKLPVGNEPVKSYGFIRKGE